MAKKYNRKQITTLVVAVLALVAVGAAAYVRDTRPAKSTNNATVNPKTDTTASSQDKGSNHPGQGSASGSTPSSSSTSSSTSTPATDPSHNSSTLAAPTGQFVSNHDISLSGAGGKSPAESSECKTVAGASCEIKLKNSDGTIISLGIKQADPNGEVIFDWNASSDPTKLSEGTWTVTATATYNSQTASATDPRTVSVSS